MAGVYFGNQIIDYIGIKRRPYFMPTFSYIYTKYTTHQVQVYSLLGDTHTCAIASRTWIWKTLDAWDR